MKKGILKLSKISNTSSFDDIKAIFNKNMDQLMLFGGGEKGEQGDSGNDGIPGEAGYSVYGDNSNTSDSGEISQKVSEFEEEYAYNGFDLYINQKGAYRVSREGGDNRNVEVLFFWKDPEDGSSNYIIPKQVVSQSKIDSLWESLSSVSDTITPKDNNHILISCDKKWNDVINDVDSTSISPITLFNDGVIQFRNQISSNAEKYIYVISAAKKESGNDVSKGMFIGQVEDGYLYNRSKDESIDTNGYLPSIYLDYTERINITDKNESTESKLDSFCYINGAAVTNVASPLCYDKSVDTYIISDDVKIIKYTTNYNSTPYFTFINKTVKSNNRNIICSFNGNILNIKGVISASVLNENENIQFKYDGDYFKNNITISSNNIIYGHTINAYGPEHIEYYGSKLEDIGLDSISIKFVSKFMNVIIRSSSDDNKSIVNEYNNDRVFIDISLVLDLNNQQ